MASKPDVQGWPASLAPRGSKAGMSQGKPAANWMTENPFSARSPARSWKPSGQSSRVVMPVHHESASQKNGVPSWCSR